MKIRWRVSRHRRRHAAHLKQFLRDRLTEHRQYICTHGQDLPEILEWRWNP
jgi:xylulose-5-phosphate/fructose-6-phosphate phosphoketolase